MESIKKIDLSILPALIEKAKNSERKRAMYCLHNSNESMLHTMINVICKKSYVCPHKHYLEDNWKIIQKWESYFILEWKAKLIFFDDIWKITDTLILDSKEKSMVLVPEWTWHTIISLTDYIAIFENKTGPYLDWKDKVFHTSFPLEGEEWVDFVLEEFYY